MQGYTGRTRYPAVADVMSRNRFQLLHEKQLSKQGQGSHDLVNSNVNCVRWLNTKAVTLMSNFAGTEPFDTARRWDKVKKEFMKLIDHLSSSNITPIWVVWICWIPNSKVQIDP